MRTSHHRRIVVVIHIHYTIQAITEQQLVLSCSSHVCRDCVVCSVGVCIRMDQIFGNRCLTWRVLRMCWDIAEMTIKCFSVFFSCTANRLKVPHRLTDNMAKQAKTTSGIVVSFPFPFRFRDWLCTKTKRKNILLSSLKCLNTFWARAMWGISFLPSLSLWRRHPESSLLVSYPYFLT